MQNGPDDSKAETLAELLEKARHLETKGHFIEAESLWREAIRAGSPEAAYHMGMIKGRQQQKAGAERYYRLAAEQFGDPEAMNNLAIIYRNNYRFSLALQWWRKAASTGHSEAMANLGALLAELGREEDALPWLEAAARNGQEAAKRNLIRLRGRSGTNFHTGQAV